MAYPLLSTVRSLLKASHFGPTLLVVTLSFAIALSQFNFSGALQIALAIFTGQLIVGWSNEVIDFPLDKAAQRERKPLVSGELSIILLKNLIPVTLALTVVLSFISPLGALGTLIHLLGILSATSYNLKLKATVFSPLPYLISFGALPWAIFLPAGNTPPFWLYSTLALFSLSFHFLNVIKDLQWDLDQNILGLPQRLGKKKSIVIAFGLVAIGFLILIFFI
jgi:4-hydroxybenzoate polyprenyltransferase